MHVFFNPVGAGSLWFHNLATADGTQVGYDPHARAFIPTSPFCVNREIIGCNWIAPNKRCGELQKGSPRRPSV